MNCIHGVSEHQHCAAAWRRQFGTVAWATTARCGHRASTLVDGSDSERILSGTCKQCGTALPEKGKR